MNRKICILDYGSGNVLSVHNLVKHLGIEAEISNSPEQIVNCSHLILPGVGAFGSSMQKIKDRLPLEILAQEVLDNNKPFLGICVGMQILADVGHEFGKHCGLGWIPGEVKMIESGGLSLPHIGWNDIIEKRESGMLNGLKSIRDFYFVHSYVYVPLDEDCVVATAEYGTTFPVIIQRGNLYGVQFHPEKSQKAGEQLMLNFFNL